MFWINLLKFFRWVLVINFLHLFFTSVVKTSRALIKISRVVLGYVFCISRLPANVLWMYCKSLYFNSAFRSWNYRVLTFIWQKDSSKVLWLMKIMTLISVVCCMDIYWRAKSIIVRINMVFSCRLCHWLQKIVPNGYIVMTLFRKLQHSI